MCRQVGRRLTRESFSPLMAHDGDHGMAGEGCQVQRTRKNRRQQAWLSQPPAGAGGGGRSTQSGARRLLPELLRRGYEPPPPWRSGGMGGAKQKKKEVAGEGRPWPFQDGAPKPKRGGEKVPCCNPRCPGVAGRQSFKYDYAIGRGQNRWQCVACNMPWERSWHVHFNGHAPPLGAQSLEGSAGRTMRKITGRMMTLMVTALPIMPWVMPTKPSLRRSSRSLMRHQGKRASTISRRMIAPLARRCSRPMLKPWPPSKLWKGLFFDTLRASLLGLWMCFGKRRTKPGRQ